jgi:WD40 repeat protein
MTELGHQELLVGNATTLYAQTVGVQLVDARQRYLTIVQERVADGDRDTLRAFVQDRVALHTVLGTYGSHGRVRDLSGEPFNRRDELLVHSGRALAALGLALVSGPEAASDHVEVFRRWMDHAGLRVPSGLVRTIDETVQPTHRDVIQHLASRDELDPLTFTWLLELDGWLHPESGRSCVRTGPGVQVLLDLGPVGQRAELRLSTARALPPGLIPDPSRMSLTSADSEFQNALRSAWQLAGGSRTHAVLWSLGDRSGPVRRIGGPSLGAAFTVLLDECNRLSRPVRGPLTVRRLQPSNAIVGAVGMDSPDRMVSVKGYEAKLKVVNDNMRIILPRPDRAAAIEADRSGFAQLTPVDTWREAAAAGRRMSTRRLLTIVASTLAVLAVLAGYLYVDSASAREAEQRRAKAADLSAQAIGLRGTDPTLAAKVALAAHHIDPENPRAVDALRELLADNRNVARAWQADPSRLDAIAVNEELSRVVTSGSDEHTKVWTLDGKFVGQIDEHSLDLVTADVYGLAAGITEDGRLMLYDIGGDTPAKLADLPKATCLSKYTSNVADMAFVNQGANLIAIWDDGAVSTYDVVARQQIACTTPDDALTPLPNRDKLPVQKIVDADVVTHEDGQVEIVALLTTHDVVAFGPGGGNAAVEVPSTAIPGKPLSIAGAEKSVSVATDHGVAVWERASGRLLTNPAGGLRTRPSTIEYSHGNLLISGVDGTASVQVDNQSAWWMADSLGELNGGAATVAAINNRAIVAGGPGGRVWVIADATNRLITDQTTFATDTAFLPDGRMVSSSARESSGESVGTRSTSLVLLDPKRPPQTETGEDNNVDASYVLDSDWTSFFANEVAAAPGFAAAGGQVGDEAVVLVWTDDNKGSPHRLTLTPPNDAELDRAERWVNSIGITPNGRYIVARHLTGQLGIWSTKTWDPVAELKFPAGPPESHLTVNANRVMLISGQDADAQLVRARVPDGTVQRRVPAPGVVHLTASTDGSVVVTITKDGLAQVRNADLEPIGKPWRPAAAGYQVSSIVIDPKGRLLAVVQGDKVLVYDLSTRLLAFPELVASNRTIVDVTWSPDSKLLAGMSKPPQDGPNQVSPLRLWNVGDLNWDDQVCGWAGGGFSTADWTRYVGEDIPYTDICGDNH